MRRAFVSGRAASCYLICGSPAACSEIAAGYLATVFCQTPGPAGEPCGECSGCRRAANRTHPDIHVAGPEKKSRAISVESVRRNVIEAVSTTPYEGGWQAVVVEYADCLNEASSNALLKTLEEPPPRTLFILETEKPENLLPTIISRARRVEAGRSGSSLLEDERGALAAALASPGPDSPLARAACAAAVGEVFLALQNRAERETDAEIEAKGEAGASISKDEAAALASSRYRGYRRDALAEMEAWFRDIAAAKCAGPGKAPLAHESLRETVERRAAALSAAKCFANVEAVERLAASLDRNLPETMALSAAFGSIASGCTEEEDA